MGLTYATVTIVGRSGGPPRVTKTRTGMTVANLRVAVNVSRKDQEPKTNWFNIACFDKLADAISPHIKAGTLLIIEGTLDLGDPFEVSDGNRTWREHAPKIIASKISYFETERQERAEEYERPRAARVARPSYGDPQPYRPQEDTSHDELQTFGKDDDIPF